MGGGRASLLAVPLGLAAVVLKGRDVLPYLRPIPTCAALSLAGLLVTLRAVPRMRAAFLRAGLSGVDLSKKTAKRDAAGNLVRPVTGPPVPEATGVVSCAAYLVCLFLFIPVPFAQPGVPPYASDGFPHAELAKLLCALLSICCMCFLGFADNVLELRWRDRLVLPLAASLPVLMTYAATGGATWIKVPAPVAHALGLRAVVDIGALYYVYISMLTIFCTNAINILAGVNGLEVGQSVVIGASMAAFNLTQLLRSDPADEALRANSLFSIYVLLPFIGCSLGLLYHNWYPAEAFVGDTYCYFAGMTVAVAGILGHYSKTMLLFFLPQVANFVYSLPQLFHLLPCPRHRMPAYDPTTDRLIVSTCSFTKGQLSAPGRVCYAVLSGLRLVRAQEGPGGEVTMSNLTVINFALYTLGPMREDRLTVTLLGVQLAASAVAFLVRYPLAAALYGAGGVD